MHPRSVDLLKVDVERAELSVLQGVKDEDWPRIKQVAVEVRGGGEGRLGAEQPPIATCPGRLARHGQGRRSPERPRTVGRRALASKCCPGRPRSPAAAQVHACMLDQVMDILKSKGRYDKISCVADESLGPGIFMIHATRSYDATPEE